jgi:hypothetical protein
LSEHGSPALLDRIEERLLEAGARRSGSASKLSRVLADRFREDTDQADADAASSAGAAVLAYRRDQTDTLRRYDPPCEPGSTQSRGIELRWHAHLVLENPTQASPSS